MSTAQKRTRLYVSLGAIAVTACVAVTYVLRYARPVAGEARGRITAVDAKSRMMSLEYIHRRNGRRYVIASQVPEDCEIRIEGRAARLDELQAGMEISAAGLVYPSTGKVVAQRINVEPASASLAGRVEPDDDTTVPDPAELHPTSAPSKPS